MNDRSSSDIILYSSPEGTIRVEVLYAGETFWLSQKRMAELFGVEVPAVSKHLKNIFETAELQEDSVVSKMETTAADGKNYTTAFYNLDAIIAVGYRVNSRQATQFRIWATKTLREFIVKGFVLDDERLKQGKRFGKDYFDELLVRIRDIRASEKRVYLRVREIFTLAADYQPSVRDTNLFFQTIQNKLHFASTGQTAAELVYRRADAAKPFMGLTHTAAGEVRKKDIKTAKNYLHEMEIDQLNRIVTMWLDFAEDQAQRKKQVFLRDWAEKLDQFLQFNDREVLQGAGKISKKQADAKAEAEYERYAAAQRQLKETQGESDIAELLKLQPKK